MQSKKKSKTKNRLLQEVPILLKNSQQNFSEIDYSFAFTFTGIAFLCSYYSVSVPFPISLELFIAGAWTSIYSDTISADAFNSTVSFNPSITIPNGSYWCRINVFGGFFFSNQLELVVDC